MTTQPHQAPAGGTFGLELRRRRTAEGWSLAELGRRTHYTKGYLSRVETGHQVPSTSLARQCDALLGADGELARLVPPKRAKSSAAGTSAEANDGTWVIELREDGASMFHPMGRREMLTLGIASLAGIVRKPAPSRPGNALRDYRALFDLTRQIGQTSSPTLVLPMVITQAHALRGLLPGAGPKERTELALLAARNAEYAGWMAQESGNIEAALWWTRKSVEIAAEVGDQDLAAYSLVRYALVTMYQRDATATIELARSAQADRRTPPRIRGLAAQREGQGHALAGDYDNCMRALDRARTLLQAASAQPSSRPLIGTSYVSDPVAVVEGWCLHDLGRPARAVEVLDREVARIPKEARRSWARFAARQALAHATAGNLERACELTHDLVAALQEVDSDTVLCDVRSLAAVLRRWHNHAMVRDLDPLLTEALHRAS